MGTRAKWRWVLVCVVVLVSPSAVAEDIPDLELLEFLSDWQDEDGDFLEPDMFDGEEQAKPEPEGGGADAPE